MLVELKSNEPVACILAESKGLKYTMTLGWTTHAIGKNKIYVWLSILEAGQINPLIYNHIYIAQ